MCASWHRALTAASALALASALASALAAAPAVSSVTWHVSVASAAPLCLSTRVSSPIMSPTTSCMTVRLGLVLLVAMLLPRLGEEGAGCFLTLRVVSAPPHEPSSWPSSVSCAGSASAQGLTTRMSSPITACMMALLQPAAEGTSTKMDEETAVCNRRLSCNCCCWGVPPRGGKPHSSKFSSHTFAHCRFFIHHLGVASLQLLCCWGVPPRGGKHFSNFYIIRFRGNRDTTHPN